VDRNKNNFLRRIIISRVSGDGLESNYAVSTNEVLVADFTLKLMNVRKVNYTGFVVNNMGRSADLYHDL
jgi:hypothetical protein